MTSFAPGTYADLAFVLFGQSVVVRYTPTEVTWPERLRAVLPQQYRTAAPPEATILAVEYVAKETTPWHVSYDKYTNMLPDEQALIQHLEWQIYTVGVRGATNALALHAGAVARDGRALLLPALSGRGKTTLTLAMIARGWQVLTDDVCPLDHESERLVALPCDRCCHVSESSLAQLQSLGVALDGPIAGLPEYFRPQHLGSPAPIHWVIAPSFDPDAPLAVTPMTQAECAALLIESSFRQDQYAVRQQWQAAIQVACQAKGMRLSFPTLAQGLAAITEFTRE